MATRRLYYDDAYEQNFDAEVLSCEPVAVDAKAGIVAPAWGVVLDRTALYPTSGGQPSDLGKLGDANVVDVRDEGEEILHVVDRRVKLGPVSGCIHWPRRFDHMQQHTGQHLLSAMFQERFAMVTVSFHLGSEICTIDLRGPEPTEHSLEGAERAANQGIFENRPVTVRYGTAEQLARVGVRTEVERSGILRAIEIERADLQPCGGTHVKHTGEIGLILVRRCAKVRQDWRVEFVCGGRAERFARQDFVMLRAAAGKLGCSTEEVASAAERVVRERDSYFRTLRLAEKRLAESDAVLALEETKPDADGLRVVARVFQGSSQEYLGAFGGEIAKSEKAIALAAGGDGGHLFFAQHPSAGKNMTELLTKVFAEVGGKGGGPRDFARGRLNDASQAEAAVELAKKILSAG
jgi:alanyl-tRNA synthetase